MARTCGTRAERPIFQPAVIHGLATGVLVASAAAASVLWSLPILAAGLVALLRYGFGSLFVVGESIAALLLSSTVASSAGADIAGTVQRLQANPLAGAASAGLGLALALAAASLAFRRLPAGLLLAALSAAWAWHCGMLPVSLILLAGCLSAGSLAASAVWLAARP